MNWEMIGAIGEIVGAAAVVASLVYLARQVALSNRLAQAEAWRTPISDLNSLNASFGMDPQFREAFYAVLEGAEPRDLSADGAQLMDVYLISVCNMYEQLFREVSDGVLDTRFLSEFVGGSMFQFPFTRATWYSMRQRLGPSFVEYVEKKHDLSASPDALSDRSLSFPDPPTP